jgi:signal transduction histidine kinase
MAYTGAFALVATVAVASIPALRFAYVSPTTKVAMETAQAVIALTVAVLVHGRVRRGGSRAELLLLVALGIAATGNLFTVVVRALDESQGTFSPFAAWSTLAMTLVAATCYAASGHLPERPLPRPWRSARRGLGLAVLACAAIWLGLTVISDRLPPTVSGEFDVAASSRPSLDASATALAVHGLALVLFAVAAVGFAGRATRRDGDPLLAAVAAGLLLAGTARLNFVLYPSAHTSVVHTGDALRLGFYLLLLAGAYREITAYWQDRAQLAVLDERQRIARDLHDGMMQELTFIRSQVSAFRTGPPEPVLLDFVVTAADRALAESRQAVRTLSDATPDAVDVVVRRTVAELADRAGLAVRYDLAPGVHLDRTTTEQIRRIAREATTNAVRHAGASTLTVRLRHGSGSVQLMITDDGAGFDPRGRNEGFGLRSMRERARTAGGRLQVEPGPDGGTRVRLELPVDDEGRGDPQELDDDIDQPDSVA